MGRAGILLTVGVIAGSAAGLAVGYGAPLAAQKHQVVRLWPVQRAHAHHKKRAPTAPTQFVGSVETTGALTQGGRYPAVAPLRALYTPDLLVRVSHPITPRQLSRLRRINGIKELTVLSEGTVDTVGQRLTAVGVDPGQFRSFTPKLTAASNALWQVVARGELAASFYTESKLRRHFGHWLAVGRRVEIRLGAFASIGLAGVDAVVSDQAARALHLAPRREVLLAAPGRPMVELARDVHRILGVAPTATVRALRPLPFNQSLISPLARRVIPANYLRLYRAAALTCPGLPWVVLAAIGTVESGNGSNVGPSSAGAEGPMQFLPSTFRAYGIDMDGDGIPNIKSPVDSIYSAAHYLCMSGAGRGGQSLYDAVFAYNHADWYVRDVLSLALKYQ
jgi:hypothetical protein